ncbi:MAG: phasin family protein [Magnetovibrionaceae bacterium]
MAKAASKSQPTFDLTAMMGEFDPSKYLEEFTKMAGEYKVPGVDVNILMETQRKNVEALSAANKVAIEGVQAIAKRQAEILQETLDGMKDTFETLAAAGTPQDAATKQVELTKAAFEKAVSNMKELSEMLAKSNGEATAAINARISESLDEVKKLADSLPK